MNNLNSKKADRANMHLPTAGRSSAQYKKALAAQHNESYSSSTIQKRFARILSETAKGLEADGVLRVLPPVTSKVLATKCTDGSDDDTTDVPNRGYKKGELAVIGGSTGPGRSRMFGTPEHIRNINVGTVGHIDHGHQQLMEATQSRIVDTSASPIQPGCIDHIYSH